MTQDLNGNILCLAGDTRVWKDSPGEGHHSPGLAQVHNKIVEQLLQLKGHAAWDKAFLA